MCHGCRFNLWSGYIQESTSEFMDGWNNKLVSLSLSLCLFPPSLYPSPLSSSPLPLSPPLPRFLSIKKSLNKNLIKKIISDKVEVSFDPLNYISHSTQRQPCHEFGFYDCIPCFITEYIIKISLFSILSCIYISGILYVSFYSFMFFNKIIDIVRQIGFVPFNCQIVF